ncbi:efflux RND transporter permease subunit [Komagataeibacter rhaeticus]
MPLTEVEDYVDTRLAEKISQISGVGLVTLSGGNRKALRVRVNIPKLTSFGIDLDTLRTTIGNVNVNSPTGTLRRARSVRPHACASMARFRAWTSCSTRSLPTRTTAPCASGTWPAW